MVTHPRAGDHPERAYSEVRGTAVWSHAQVRSSVPGGAPGADPVGNLVVWLEHGPSRVPCPVPPANRSGRTAIGCSPISGFRDAPLGYIPAMPPEEVVKGRAPLADPPRQLSFDELAALRVSDEANADSVIAEILAHWPSRTG